MVDEDLEEVLDSDDLFRAQLEVSITLTLETLPIRVVIDHSLDNLECHIRDILHCDACIAILVSLDERDV